MAKLFSAKLDKEIFNYAKKSNEKAQLPILRLIPSSNLIDYPNNSEDLSDTSDLENSIQNLGFTDPLEVTPAAEKDIYMILSGHRRRLAGVRRGIETFPCLVKHFDNERDMFNYVLLANSHRDSSKDPLLIPKRYKMHEAYLEACGFNGNKREEIAKRLGISIPQADRYNYFNKIISPVWDLVRAESVGMSSVIGMSSLTVEDQNKVYQIFLQYLEKENRISREKCDLIIQSFKAGKAPEDILKSIDVTPVDTKEDGEEFKESADADEVKDPSESASESEDFAAAAENEIKPEITHEILSKDERQRQRGIKIGKNLEKLSSSINKGYEFPDKETAKVTLKSMSDFITLMFSEIREMSVEYNINEIFDTLKNELKTLMEQSK